MILVLALVALAVYGIVFLLRKKTNLQAAQSDPFLKILSSSHLGNNRFVHIVSAGNRAWLLGSSDGGVNLISEIDDKDLINSMMFENSNKAADTASPRASGFISFLQKLGAPVEKKHSDADEIRKRRERLKGL